MPRIQTFILQLISPSCAGTTVQLPADLTMQIINTTISVKKLWVLLEIGGRWRVKPVWGGLLLLLLIFHFFLNSDCFSRLAYGSAIQTVMPLQLRSQWPAMQELGFLVLPLKQSCYNTVSSKQSCHNTVPSVSLISMSYEYTGVHRMGCKGLNGYNHHLDIYLYSIEKYVSYDILVLCTNC